MRIPKLDARLKAVASLIRSGDIVADIGCDHAYLAVYLIHRGMSSRVYAADIHEKPLSMARKTVEKFHMLERIQLIQSDGLEKISRDIQSFVIAGMGGEQIMRIIQAAPWTKKQGLRFVLQPMSFVPELRSFLYLQGYQIDRELPVIVGKHSYCVLSGGYIGKSKKLTLFESVAGKMLDQTSEAARQYLQQQQRKYRMIGQKRGWESYLSVARELEYSIQAGGKER